MKIHMTKLKEKNWKQFRVKSDCFKGRPWNREYEAGEFVFIKSPVFFNSITIYM